MDWFYVYKEERKGPISARDLLSMEQSGAISPTTLVWHEGMDAWKPLGAKSGDLRAEVPDTENLVPMGVCAYSGDIRPQSEMVAYGEQFVTPEHKDDFVQSLVEGNPAQPTLGGVVGMRPAGFWIRFGAKFIDGIILGIVNYAVMAIVMIPMGVMGSSGSGGGSGAAEGALVFGMFLVMGVTVLLPVAYNAFMVGKWGATLGKMACGIRVTDPRGGMISYPRAIGRGFAEFLSQMILYIGYIMVAFDEHEKKALHDMICETRVVFK